MAKGSGGTRGAKKSSSTAKSKSDSYQISSLEYDRRQDVFRGLGAGPVPNYMARQYKESTGLDMPNDAIELHFGRGALSGDVVEQTLSFEEYSNIRKVDYYDKIGRDYVTFVTGYKSEAQLTSFLKDCKTGVKVKEYNRLQKLWNRRGGTLGGL